MLHRAERPHRELRQLRELVDDALGDAVAQIFGGRDRRRRFRTAAPPANRSASRGTAKYGSAAARPGPAQQDGDRLRFDCAGPPARYTRRWTARHGRRGAARTACARGGELPVADAERLARCRPRIRTRRAGCAAATSARPGWTGWNRNRAAAASSRRASPPRSDIAGRDSFPAPSE